MANSNPERKQRKKRPNHVLITKVSLAFAKAAQQVFAAFLGAMMAIVLSIASQTTSLPNFLTTLLSAILVLISLTTLVELLRGRLNIPDF